jgi:hypothetical protein
MGIKMTIRRSQEPMGKRLDVVFMMSLVEKR